MDATDVAQTGLVGWREKVAASVAGPVSERTPLADEQGPIGRATQALFIDRR